MKKTLWKIKMFFNPYQMPIFYSPMDNAFFQVKYSQVNGLWCGAFTIYYSDAQTNICRQLLSYDYVWKCQEVKALDKAPYAELCTVVNDYKVKGR